VISPMDQLLKPRAAPHIERPDSLRGVELVPGHREEIHPQLIFWKVFNMSHGGLDDVVSPQKLLEGLHLCGRFHNNQTL